MGKVRTGLAVSLDGFISGPNDDADAPMGHGGERLRPGTALATPNTGCPEPTWSSRCRPRPPSSSARPARRPGRWCLAEGPSTSPMAGVATTPWMCRSLWSAAQPHQRGSPKDRRSPSSPTDWKAPSSKPKRLPATRTSAGAASIVQQCIRATPGRDPHRPGAGPARGRRQLVRPSRHRADRPGAHAGDRGRGGDPPHLPRPKVNRAARLNPRCQAPRGRLPTTSRSQ